MEFLSFLSSLVGNHWTNQNFDFCLSVLVNIMVQAAFFVAAQFFCTVSTSIFREHTTCTTTKNTLN
jgi:hypothetical protein